MTIEPGEDADAAGASDRLVLHNNASALRQLSRWLRAWADAHALPAEISFALGACLEQAITDILLASDAEHEVAIVIEIERTVVTLVARIEDNGRPLPYPAAQAKVNALERARMGDLGFRLMRSLASGIEYERVDECNRLTLRFLRSEPSTTLTG